jgi:hypothetical protein
MGTYGKRKGRNPIIQGIRANWVHPHHAVGQKHGRARGFEENTNIANGGIDKLHLSGSLASKRGDCGQNSQFQQFREVNPNSDGASNFRCV